MNPINFLVILQFSLVPFFKCAVVELQNKTAFRSLISTICDLTNHPFTGYCVPVHNCLALVNSSLNDSELLQRKCGPHNEDKTHPKVCCEERFLYLETSSSTTVVPPVSLQREENLSACGAQLIENRVVGGNPTENKEFPWLGRLLRKDSFGEEWFSCTGALISSKVVLTAAHCLVAESLVQVGELYAVALGDNAMDCNQTECLKHSMPALVGSFLAHPRYDNDAANHDHDIGLVFLKYKIKFTNYIVPICLLTETIEPTEYYVAGWGKTESGNISSEKLKTTLLPFSWERCKKRYRSINIELTSRQICAGGVEGKDSCQGDSGGPLMLVKNGKWYVAGVVSFGLSCGRKEWPGIHASVPDYLNWIKTNMV